MGKNEFLKLGLYSSCILVLLDNRIVHETIISIFTLFDNSKVDGFLFEVSSIILRLITIFSFVGIVLTLYFIFKIIFLYFKGEFSK